MLTLTLLGLTLTGKILGSTLGGRVGGLTWREAWGAGFGMGAQGTMGIILGVLAMQFGFITQSVFVALVIVALVTSLVSGPLLQWLLHLKRPRLFTDYLSSTAFVRRLRGSTPEAAIHELAQVLAPLAGMDVPTIAEAAIAREHIMPTGIGQGIAIPHARLEGLAAPLVGIGLAENGIDFDAPDGMGAQIICLILTPVQDDGAQLEILADIAATFKGGLPCDKVLQISGHTEFLALVRSAHLE